ncbi:Uncharacterized protein dnm_095930 [Desulfonema magnum]|uniref:Uncharacterized protein n=1 Tax=Desulfonema magnum TaxID=45655 RepID=A0A975GTY9_9BACT|nr:Uncharacterized protein dnm_095930 [Desulfonema magnum]
MLKIHHVKIKACQTYSLVRRIFRRTGEILPNCKFGTPEMLRRFGK